MQKRPKKKSSKMRGRRAMGYGFSAGHRASGQRGGKGMAGTKKHHYIKTILEDPDYFGKHGFKRPQKIIEGITIVNVGEIDAAAEKLVARGLASKTGKRYSIDVSKLGVDKILGSGKVTRRLNLTGVKAITNRAREKITEKGGTVDLPTE
jgi:large subunit ribosomal protein L15